MRAGGGGGGGEGGGEGGAEGGDETERRHTEHLTPYAKRLLGAWETHCGWLYKKGDRFNKKWQLRFFSLDGIKLKYCKTPGTKVLGSIDLSKTGALVGIGDGKVGCS